MLTSTAPGGRTGATSRTTASTTDKSASPPSPSGVGTHRNTNSASTAAAAGADDEPQPSGREAFGDQLGEALLGDVDVTFGQASDLVGVDVADDDVVAEMGQARAIGQPDVSGADDTDPAHVGRLTGTFPSAQAGPNCAASTPAPLPVAWVSPRVVLAVRSGGLGRADVLAGAHRAAATARQRDRGEVLAEDHLDPDTGERQVLDQLGVQREVLGGSARPG